MNKLHVLLAALLLAAILAPPSDAHVVDRLDMEIIAFESPAKAGQEFRATLEIIADGDQQITDFTIEGEGWSGLGWDPVKGVSLSEDKPLVVTFSGTCRRPDEPLTIIVRTDQKSIRRIITVGGSEFERRRKALPLKKADFHVPQPWKNSEAMAFTPEPGAPSVMFEVDQLADDFPVDGPKDKNWTKDSWDIRIHGRFIYVRDEDTIIGADGLSIFAYDSDAGVDDLLGSSITDAYGYFDFIVHWDSQPFQPSPDLYVKFKTSNSEVELRDLFHTLPYSFETGVHGNYTNTELDLGVIYPSNENDMDLPHLISNFTHFWRYINIHGGHDTRYLEVRYPGDEDDGSYYNRVSETIQLPTSKRWSSGTQAHEYGHHIMNCFLPDMPEIDYCNGNCDENPPFDCSHCRWCEEEHPISWTEGWAQYSGHRIPNSFDATYGIPCINAKDFADIETCDEDGLYHDPIKTEGFVAAFVVDIEDVDEDDDPYSLNFHDQVNLTDRNILDTLNSGNATTAMGFFQDLKEDFPNDTEDMWFTGMNNGIDIDNDTPMACWPLTCLSHQVGEPSSNPNISFYWPTPWDDASGVEDYYVSISYSPEEPLHYSAINGVNTYTVEDAPPGSYYFNIQPMDRAGNICTTYTSVGPIVIVEPQPINLAFQQPEGWGFYIVPRNTQDASLDYCPLPETLDSMEPTYWNLAGRNEGDLNTGANTITALMVDGEIKDSYNWGDLPGWCPFMVMNEGPELIFGGLHSITGVLDPDDLISETDENDNMIGWQFAWRPPLINPGTVYSNGFGVPDPMGGWDTLPAAWKFHNCYGLQFNSTGWWNAFVTWCGDPAVDYDLRLFDVNEDPAVGFRLTREASNQPAGWVDAVIVNRNQTGSMAWDTAVFNPNLHSGTHRFEHITSVEVAYGDSINEVMADDEYLMMREFNVGYLETGGISLDLWTDPPQADVQFSWRDMDFTTGDILDADATALTGADGHAHLEVEALEEGYTCLMICRQPKDGDEDLTVTYRIRPTLPDLTPGFVAGWYGPVVPRNDAGAVPGQVALPASLSGDVENTWFNYAVENISTGTAWAAMRFHIMIDEGQHSFTKFYLFDIEGGETKTIINDGPRTVSAGRHSVVLDIDRNNNMAELDEENNTWGRQYNWRPPQWNSPGFVTRDVPPSMIAGWSDIQAGGLYYNCDGLDSEYTNAYWRAIAVMPGGESDVDVRLHEQATSPVNGFGSNLVRSSWGPAQSDYVLVNYNLTDWRAFDAGVLGVSGSQDYQAEVLHETWLGSEAVDYGPVSMGAEDILDLYEMRLPVGTWRVSVENVSGSVDWGLSFHRSDMPYMNKNDVQDDAAAWYEPGGADEEITITIEDVAYSAITVWKVGSADMGAAGEYILHVVEGGASSVDGQEIPSVTRMAGVYPNPFNPQTTVAFELAEAAAVNLAVYDLTGRLVATLVRETYPAGRYRQVWRGKDDSGRQVASGMYVVRMRAGDATDLKKVMLVK